MWNGYFSHDCSLGISNLFYSIDGHGLYWRFLNSCFIFSFSIEISEKVRGENLENWVSAFWPRVNIFVVAYLFSWIYLLYCTFTILRKRVVFEWYWCSTCDDREMPICVFTAFSSIYLQRHKINITWLKPLQKPQLHYLTMPKSLQLFTCLMSLIDRVTSFYEQAKSLTRQAMRLHLLDWGSACLVR